MNTIKLDYELKKGAFNLSVDTQIPAAGITGVFGASGSGKTTLLRCIAGLEQSASKDREPVHKRRIGFVFQEPQLFAHLSVRRNIEYGLRRSAEPDKSTADVVRLLDVEHLLERDASGLSGGEAQRVSIARTLCQFPRLILMDEPLSGLDQRRRDEVLPYLDRLHAESSIPIIYVSHNIDEICRLSDYLLLIDAGRIVAQGGLQETLIELAHPQLAGHNAGAVLEARKIEYDESYDLTSFGFSGGELWVPGQFEAPTARLKISASDVSVSTQPAESSSILNIIPAVIDAIEPESRSTTLLRLRLGRDFIVARITQRSSRRLGLKIGDDVFAQVKSVTVRR